jgi:hypothetical protein
MGRQVVPSGQLGSDLVQRYTLGVQHLRQRHSLGPRLGVAPVHSQLPVAAFLRSRDAFSLATRNAFSNFSLKALEFGRAWLMAQSPTMRIGLLLRDDIAPT